MNQQSDMPRGSIIQRRQEQERFTTTQGAILALIAIILLLLFLAIRTVGSDAPTPEQNLHLSAGELDARLVRTALVKRLPDGNGVFSDLTIQSPNDPPIDFSEPSDRNVFELGDPAELVPGASFTAAMRLSNTDDVAVGYWIEISLSDPTLADQLAGCLSVSVTLGDGGVFRGDALHVKGEGDGFIDSIAISASGDFSVTVEVLSPIDGIDGASVLFDLVVHCVIGEGETPPPPVTDDPTPPPPVTDDPTPPPPSPELTLHFEALKLFSLIYDPTGDIVDPLGNRYSQTEVSRFPNGGSATYQSGELSLSGITPGDKVAFAIVGENTGDALLRVRLSVECLEGELLMSGLVVTVNGERYTGDAAYVTEYLTLGVGETMPEITVSLELPYDAGNEYMGQSTQIRIRVEAICPEDCSESGGAI